MTQNFRELQNIWTEKQSRPLPTKVVATTAKGSKFIYDLKQLQEETAGILKHPPFKWLYMQEEVYEERKLQIQILARAIQEIEGDPSRDESPLIVDCLWLKKYSTTLPYPSDYNDFVTRLTDIINNLEPKQINRGPNSNVFKLQVEELVLRAKTQYAEKLKADPELQEINKILNSHNVNKIIQELAVILKQIILSELHAIRTMATKNLDGIRYQHEIMKQSFDRLLKEMEVTSEVLRVYKLRHAVEYQEVIANVNHELGGPIRNGSPMKTAALVARFGLSSSSSSPAGTPGSSPAQGKRGDDIYTSIRL